jgi:hypothetical protein
MEKATTKVAKAPVEDTTMFAVETTIQESQRELENLLWFRKDLTHDLQDVDGRILELQHLLHQETVHKVRETRLVY